MRAAMVTATIRAVVDPKGPASTTATTKRVSTRIPAAVAIRVNDITLQSRAPRGWGRSGVDGAEAADPALEVDDRLVEVTPAHVGPEDLGEDQLAVGQLPEQEVRDAGLARGANDQVGVGHVGKVEVAPDRLLVDLVGRDALGGDGPHGVDDLGPAAVVERHGHH